MKPEDRIRELEALIAEEKEKLKTSENKESNQENEMPSFWQRLIDGFTAPFRYLARYFKAEISEAIRNDFRRTIQIILLTLILFAFTVVLWVFIQFGIYNLLLANNVSQLLAFSIVIGLQLLLIFIGWRMIVARSKRMETVRIVQRIHDAASPEESI